MGVTVLAIELSLREISYVMYARARALMTQKSCVVGMRNAKLENHLKVTRVVCQLDCTVLIAFVL